MRNAGIVTIQAKTILLATFHRTADIRLAAPTPTTAFVAAAFYTMATLMVR